MNVNHSKWPEPQSQGEGGRPLRKGRLKIYLGYASGVGKTVSYTHLDVYKRQGLFYKGSASGVSPISYKCIPPVFLRRNQPVGSSSPEPVGS